MLPSDQSIFPIENWEAHEDLDKTNLCGLRFIWIEYQGEHDTQVMNRPGVAGVVLQTPS